MTFCLLVCKMCGKGTFSQIRSHMQVNKHVLYIHALLPPELGPPAVTENDLSITCLSASVVSKVEVANCSSI